MCDDVFSRSSGVDVGRLDGMDGMEWIDCDRLRDDADECAHEKVSRLNSRERRRSRGIETRMGHTDFFFVLRMLAVVPASTSVDGLDFE